MADHITDFDLAKTLEIIRQLSEGKTLKLPKSGYEIGMGIDGFIGFVINGSVSTFCEEFTVRTLCQVLKKENIIPTP